MADAAELEAKLLATRLYEDALLGPGYMLRDDCEHLAERLMAALYDRHMVTDLQVSELVERMATLEDVAFRWSKPGGSPRLAQRAKDKLAGMEVALRVLGLERHRG